MTSLRNFLGGSGLNADVARAAHINGAPGFYMATVASDAEYFAARRIGGGSVVIVDIDDDVVEELRSLGAVHNEIPGIPPPYFAGDEIYLPEGLFATFNARMREKRIRVSF
jgi:hypothetical protein